MTVDINSAGLIAPRRDPFTNGTELKPHTAHQLSGTDQFDRMGKWLELFMATAEVAKVLARTNFVPDAFRGQPEDIAAAMMRSLELGIDPLDGLSNFHAIKGRVGMSAEFMRRRVLEAGHEIVFDEQTEERCKVRGRRKGSQEWTTVVFTKQQAAQAGTQNMSKFPVDMLVARASSRLCRRIFPDVLAGMQIIEDIADGEIIDGEPATDKPLRRKRVTATRPTEAPKPDPQPQPVADDLDLFPGGEPSPAAAEAAPTQDDNEPGITKPQLQKLSILRQREGYADDDGGRADWFQWVETNIARRVGSNKDLTKAEASVLIDVLDTTEQAE